jgi:DNA excision repair protein ERCC-6-like 2
LAHWFREGSKVLIFSYSVRLLGMLDFLMVKKSYSYCSLTGSMDLDERMYPVGMWLTDVGTATVDKFNTDPNMFVFLISTKAGGVGLNIVSANKVYVPHPHVLPSHSTNPI